LKSNSSPSWSGLHDLSYAFLVVVDCYMSNWTDCTKTCGTGTRNRSIILEAENGGHPCEGLLSETCNSEPCPGKYFLTKIVFKAKFYPTRNRQTALHTVILPD
jgi:hypothetical protein